jgi:hypothetical protein
MRMLFIRSEMTMLTFLLYLVATWSTTYILAKIGILAKILLIQGR